MGEQFGRDYRILTGGEYRRVFAKPRRVSSSAFTVLACTGERHARLGLAVSKKVDKRAVKRNQIKRIARETFRCSKLRNAAVDLVVIARPAAASASRQALAEQLRQHYHKLHQYFLRLPPPPAESQL